MPLRLKELPTIVVRERVWLPRELVALPVKVVQELSIPNGAYHRARRQGYKVSSGVPAEFVMFEETEGHFVVPRAYDWRGAILGVEGQDYRVVDLTARRGTIVGEDRVRLGPHELQPFDQGPAYAALSAPPTRVHGRMLVLRCLAGDTTVQLNRAGKGFTTIIEKMYRRFHGLDRHPVSNWDPRIATRIRSWLGERIGLSEVVDVYDNGEQPTVEVELVDGTRLRCTPDHRVMTNAGWVNAGDLAAGVHAAMTDGVDSSRSTASKLVYRRLSWYPAHPYAHKNGWEHGRQRYTLEEHRAVAEAAMNGLSLEQFRQRCRVGDVAGLEFVNPATHHVHHKDHDHRNNCIANLEVLTVDEHRIRHGNVDNFGFGVPTFVPVAAVHEALPTRVYDIECADPYHNFCANKVVVHNCGAGKTAIALKAAQARGGRTLWVTITDALVEQARDDISRYLGVDQARIGWIQASKQRWRGYGIATATLQTLAQRGDLPFAFWDYWDLVIYDEGDVLAAPSFHVVVPKMRAERWVLTATPQRSDGNDALFRLHVGDPCYTHSTFDLEPECYFVQSDAPASHVVKMGWDPNRNCKRTQYALTAKNLLHDVDRQEFIIGHVQRAVAKGRTVLVVGDSIEGMASLRQKAVDNNIDCSIVTSQTKKRDRKEAIKDPPVVFATSKLFQRGLDRAAFDTLVIASLTTVNETFTNQTTGRILRWAPDKRPIVLVIADVEIDDVRLMAARLAKRFRDYGWSVGGIGPKLLAELAARRRRQ